MPRGRMGGAGGGGIGFRDHDGDGIPNREDPDWLNRNDGSNSWLAQRNQTSRDLGQSAWQQWLESQRFRGRVNKPVINKDARKSLLAMYQPGQGPNNVTGNGPPGPVAGSGVTPPGAGPVPGAGPGGNLTPPPATPPPGTTPPPPITPYQPPPRIRLRRRIGGRM